MARSKLTTSFSFKRGPDLLHKWIRPAFRFAQLNSHAKSIVGTLPYQLLLGWVGPELAKLATHGKIKANYFF